MSIIDNKGRAEAFYFPEYGSRITKTDIENAVLRIPVGLKDRFPVTDTQLTISYEGREWTVRYTKRPGRFDMLSLGSDFMDKLQLQPGGRLKVTRQAENKFLLEKADFLLSRQETDNIGFEGLLALKRRYWETLKLHPFPAAPVNGNAAEMIHYFKRKINGLNEAIGPYTGLSVFEAANRIATDLVIINGVLQLIKERPELNGLKITVRLGNRHEAGKGDFTIGDKEGEAFNVAASFYKAKLRMTDNKWKSGKPIYILVNAEVFDEIKGENLRGDVVKVAGWDLE